MNIPFLSGNKLAELENRVKELEKKVFPVDTSSIPKETSQKKLPPFSLLSIAPPFPDTIPFKWLLEMCWGSRFDSELPVILGISEHGKVAYFDIFKASHILIGGTTGSGKTVFLWSLITALLFQRTYNDVRFIIVDPKRVDMAPYLDKLPHLLTPVITDVKEAVSAFQWTIAEMESRYKKLATAGVRNITQYNKLSGKERMPFIVFIIDELADLMLFNPGDVESKIVKLAQLSRAVGIHLIISTQRPSSDVFTGMIKANIPTRLAFSVASKKDSKIILDMPGAELLQEPGDALFLPPDVAKPIRIHTPFVSEQELHTIVRWLAKNQPLNNDDNQTRLTDEEKTEDKSKDTLFNQAVEIVGQHDFASASLLQRRLSIGYARAARLLDQLESDGIVDSAEGAKPRKVLKK